MAGKAVISLTTGLEDPEWVTVAFLVAVGRTALLLQRPDLFQRPDLSVSQRLPDGSFGPASAVTELNSAAVDLRPNVRKDGLEIVFDSNRPGTLGGFDIYAAMRDGRDCCWSAPC